MIRIEKDLLIKYTQDLLKRIIKHRTKCQKWKDMKYCYECHSRRLTKIERLLDKLKYDGA